MKKINEKGFTLIELLVVIAIIGILASVVLASLNSARAKGADAAIKANMANARAQAELFYDGGTPNTYDLVCASATTGGIYTMLNQAATSAGATFVPADGTASAAGVAQCHDSATAWAASIPLKATAGQYYCVDSTGASKQGATALAASTYVCP